MRSSLLSLPPLPSLSSLDSLPGPVGSVVGYLVEAVAGLLAVTLLAAPGSTTVSSTGGADPSGAAGTVAVAVAPTAAQQARAERDFARLPEACATPEEKIPQQPMVCYLTPFEEDRPTVFLWGDSHAWMQIPALRVAAEGRDVNLVTSIFGSCPAMVPGLSRDDLTRLGRCGLNAHLGFQFVREMRRGDQPFKVILAGNWEMYERAIGLMEQGKGPRGGHGGYAFAQAAVFRTGGPLLARRLAQWRIDVDIVGQVARPPRRTGPCAAGTAPFRCAFPRRKAFLDERGTTTWLGEVFAPVTSQGIRYLDLNEHLCTEYLCRGRVDGVDTYLDNSHLTASMARELGERFRPSVDDVLR